jgi:hypothetical protein
MNLGPKPRSVTDHFVNEDRSMKTQMASWAAWILVRIQIVTATLEPEVLQWPGGIVIALLLWLYLVARPFWSVGAGGPPALRG